MAHSLSRALAVLLSLALVCPSPGFAQKEGKEEKEKKKQDAKAHELIDENAKYKKLPKDEQKAVIDHLVYKIDQSEKELQKAWINVYTGETLAEILAQHPDSKSCDILITQEKCKEDFIPPRYRWDRKYIEIPPTGKLFEDNKSVVVEKGQDKETDLFWDALEKVTDLVKKQGGKIVSIDIESSASTFRNTGEAESMTHEQLSKARALAAKGAVLSFIKSEGLEAPADSEVELDWKGENGNGTSGPNSPFSCREPVKGKPGQYQKPSDAYKEKYCPKGNGNPPSKKELVEYINQGSAGAAEVKISDIVDTPETEEGVSRQSNIKLNTTIIGAPDSGKVTVQTPQVGGTCTAPVGVTIWDLYRAYYDQFKYIAVSMEVTFPVQLEPGTGQTIKECTARRVDVCVSTSDGGPHKKKKRHKKYLGKRVKHWFRCLFVNKKDPCSPFDCR